MPNNGFRFTSSCVAFLPMVFTRRQRSETGELVSALVKKANEIHQRQFKRFSLKELQSATDNFNPKYMMGRGCFGTVYKGQLSDGSLVAIKRLAYYTQSEDNPFLTELEITGRAIHRNLLRLRGFCSTPTEILLVYPLMVNGSVASYLGDGRENQHPLSWETRKRIALGAARGLEYLHDGCDSKIIHCDVKPGNILLDTKFEAVIGGLGSAKCMDHHDTHVTTAIRGTIGYIAPEFLLTGEASEKTDVFGYGIMLLELVTGERAFDLARLANDDEVMLLDWVKMHLEEDNLERLVDANLQGGYLDDEARRLIQLALLCTQSSAMERPNMSEVVRMLEGEGLAKRWQQ